MTTDERYFLGLTEAQLNNTKTELAYYCKYERHENFPKAEALDLLRALGFYEIEISYRTWDESQRSSKVTTFSKTFLEDLYVKLNCMWWKSTHDLSYLRLRLDPVLNWLSHTAGIPGDSPLHASDYLANGTEPSVAVDDKEALRFNEGKTPYQYLPMDLLAGAASVMEKGCEKYGKANYRKGYSDIGSPLASLMRHVAELQRSFELDDKDLGFDSESGFHHADHVVTSALLLIQTLKLKGLYTK